MAENKKFKISWGWGITIAYSLFVILMLYMVYRAMGVNTDLVKKDYYSDELKYQKTIDATKRADSLLTSIAISQQDDKVIIQFPLEQKPNKLTGTIWIYCSYNSSLDMHLNVMPDTSNFQQTIPKSKIVKGKYLVKIDWFCDGKEYYEELPLNL